MGNTPSISEKVLVPEWFARLVQPTFLWWNTSRKFLDSLRKRVNSKMIAIGGHMLALHIV